MQSKELIDVVVVQLHDTMILYDQKNVATFRRMRTL